MFNVFSDIKLFFEKRNDKKEFRSLIANGAGYYSNDLYVDVHRLMTTSSSEYHKRRDLLHQKIKLCTTMANMRGILESKTNEYIPYNNLAMYFGNSFAIQKGNTFLCSKWLHLEVRQKMLMLDLYCDMINCLEPIRFLMTQNIQNCQIIAPKVPSVDMDDIQNVDTSNMDPTNINFHTLVAQKYESKINKTCQKFVGSALERLFETITDNTTHKNVSKRIPKNPSTFRKYITEMRDLTPNGNVLVISDVVFKSIKNELMLKIQTRLGKYSYAGRFDDIEVFVGNFQNTPMWLFDTHGFAICLNDMLSVENGTTTIQPDYNIVLYPNTIVDHTCSALHLRN